MSKVGAGLAGVRVKDPIQVEKEKARKLRKSRWWQNRIAQGAHCYYCSIELTPQKATMDHVVPLAQGGKSTPGNIVVCCKACNSAKKDGTGVDFLLETVRLMDEKSIV